MDHDVDRGGGERDLVPPQEQVGLRPGMRPQHRRRAEKSLARHNALAGGDDFQRVHLALTSPFAAPSSRPVRSDKLHWSSSISPSTANQQRNLAFWLISLPSPLPPLRLPGKSL